MEHEDEFGKLRVAQLKDILQENFVDYSQVAGAALLNVTRLVLPR